MDESQEQGIIILEKLKVPHKITLYQRAGIPNIYFYFTFKGRREKRSTKTDNLDEARKVASRAYLDVESGRVRSKSHQFDKIAQKFLKFKAPHVTLETIEGYEYRAKTLIAFFKNKDITTFVRKDFTDYIEWRGKSRKSRKSKQAFTAGDTTFNRDLALLRSILIFANEEYDLSMRIPNWKPLPEKKRTTLLNSEELLRLKNYWLDHNPFYWDVLNFILNTGLRYPSEIVNLQWKNVDLENKLLRIKRKSRLTDKDKYWVVPLLDEAIVILTKLKSRSAPVTSAPDDYVFVDNKNRKLGDIKKAYKSALKVCEITKDFPIFSFRHQFATEMTAKGYPPKFIADAMGHKSIKMIDSTYTHMSTEHWTLIKERIGIDNKLDKDTKVSKPRKYKIIGFTEEDMDRLGITDEKIEFLINSGKLSSNDVQK